MTTLQEFVRLVDECYTARERQQELGEPTTAKAALMSAISRVVQERTESGRQANAREILAGERALRIAVLEKALKASPCTIDGFDRLVWDCKERDCLRCAALAKVGQMEGK